MMLARADDDDDDDDNDSVFASGSLCVCVRDEYIPLPPDGWLSLRRSMPSLSASRHEASPTGSNRPAPSRPPRPSPAAKVTVSRKKEDRSGNEFNISTADSCGLIVVPVKQIQHFQRGKETAALS